MTKRSQLSEEVRQECSRLRKQRVQRWNEAGLFRNIKEVSVANVSSRETGMEEVMRPWQ